MDIIIHTAGRALNNLQHTHLQLLEAGIPHMLLVQAHEAKLYEHIGPLHVLPPHINTLAPTRDYIIHEMPGDDHVVFMDDDLHFAVRRDDERDKFRQPQPHDIKAMIAAIDKGLKLAPMVGIGGREGGNRITEEHVWNTRLMRVLAFRRSYLKKHMLTFSPLVVMEDFHINLQILRSGEDTLMLNNWVSNQAGGSDAPGGCSVYRTPQVQTSAAHMLRDRHPGFVRVVEKTTKSAWGGGTRTDVVVQWKAAAAAGKRSKP